MTGSQEPMAAEDDANSGLSYEGGSSGDETAHNAAVSASAPKKRKREKHQKTS